MTATDNLSNLKAGNMKNKLLLAAGIAAGYVLGARAGRQRYDQIANAAKKFADNPKVQQTASQLSQQATDAVSKVSSGVGSKVGDRIPARLKSGSSSDDYSASTTAGDLQTETTGTGYPTSWNEGNGAPTPR
jgi:outer membrane murein-binding lipoprotein Lpp